MIELLIGLLFLLIFLSVPVSFAIAISAIAIMIIDPTLTPLLFVQRTFAGLNSFVILAIPLFVLTAEIMNASGLTDRLIKCSYAMVGHLRGGLAQVNILVSLIFAGISGSATADTAGMGSMLIPAMIKRKYPKDFTIAVTATSSTLGQIIPPKIIAVIYAATVGISVGALFLAGIMAGIIICLSMMTIAYIFDKKRGYPREEKMSTKERIVAIVTALPPVVTPIIVIGGIFSGFFTATEAAVISTLYALILSICYRSMTPKKIWIALSKAGKMTAVTAFCIGAANTFGFLLAIYRFPQTVATFISNYIHHPTVFLLFVFLIFLLVGSFLDATPCVILLAPIIATAADAIGGINPIHLGAIVVLTMALGLVTPPYGLCALIACKIADYPMQKTFKVMSVFIAANIAIIILFIFVPDIILFIPRTFAPHFMP